MGGSGNKVSLSLLVFRDRLHGTPKDQSGRQKKCGKSGQIQQQKENTQGKLSLPHLRNILQKYQGL